MKTVFARAVVALCIVMLPASAFASSKKPEKHDKHHSVAKKEPKSDKATKHHSHKSTTPAKSHKDS